MSIVKFRTNSRFTSLLLAASLLQGGMAVTATPASAGGPQTTILSGPTGLIASRSATFKFKSNSATAKFQCKLDSGSWTSCTSPKKYTKLAQENHAFRVRASKNGVVDSTPATRSFAVDTIKPQTTVERQFFSTRVVAASVTYEFTSSEPGTFQCRLNSARFRACVSPFSPEVLPDTKYTFEVRARDTAGNADATPASEQFDKVPLLSFSQETGEVAAEYFVPDQLALDVPSRCGSSYDFDCSGGTPTPPDEQLSISSTRAVTKPAGQNRYDMTVTMGVGSVQPFTLTTSFAGDCSVTVDSSNGSTATWTYSLPLNVPLSAFPDFEQERFIFPGSETLSGVEDQDYLVTGSSSCRFMDVPTGVIEEAVSQALAARFNSLCMAAGPPLFETCPWVG